MPCSPEELTRKSETFFAKWQSCKSHGGLDGLVEFAVSVSGFTEFLEAKGLSGLHQSAHALEQVVLSLFDHLSNEPIPAAALESLDQKVSDFKARITTFLQGSALAIVERRMHTEVGLAVDLKSSKSIWFVTSEPEVWKDLVTQAGYFKIRVDLCALQSEPAPGQEPVIVLVDAIGWDANAFEGSVKTLRARFSTSYIMGLNLASNFEVLNAALGAGCDFCFPLGSAQSVIMARIVKLCGHEEEDPYRVLVVEDSKTATALIQRTLKEAGMESMAIAKPQEVLTSLVKFKPDLVLMDMFMPGCTGVEVTRVIRQHEEFLSTPVVYLSGDASVALQVDALRLGGDHFLTKPFNPVILNAVVKSKIDRYRMLRRSMTLDSLTGLLNHITSKQRLDAAVTAAQTEGAALCVAMVDIDFFKKVNDGYGHPMGDQVIRSLAWLLKQRLRKTDAVGRYGGEEFLVILPDANATQAQLLLDRIRLDFSQFHHALAEGYFVCTFSGGVCELAPGLTGPAMIKRADEGLYVAKRQGRNQIIIQ
jgi:diguanylate cyclase (GGDEF)-like protein